MPSTLMLALPGIYDLPTALDATAVIACCVSLTFHAKVYFILQVSKVQHYLRTFLPYAWTYYEDVHALPTNKGTPKKRRLTLTTKKLTFQKKVSINLGYR